MTTNLLRSSRLSLFRFHRASVRRFTQGALDGVRVVELSGTIASSFCGQILADFGADVTCVQRVGSMEIEQRMTRNKKCVELDFNSVGGMIAIKEICAASDVLIDPFRPGVLERFGMEPTELMKQNKGLLIARISGYGQFGPLAGRPGNDINFVSMSGILPRVSGKDRDLWPPANLLGDVASGGLLSAFGICAALLQRSRTGEGCVLDCSTVDGLTYLSTFLHAFKDVDLLWTHDFGVFSSRCPIYRTYETKDGKHVAVGAVERRFNLELFKTLGITKKLSEMIANPEQLVAEMERIFKQKTQAEWVERFKDSNACVTPVLELDEVHQLEHHKQRETFQPAGDDLLPRPQPRMFKAEELAALQRAGDLRKEEDVQEKPKKLPTLPGDLRCTEISVLL